MVTHIATTRARLLLDPRPRGATTRIRRGIGGPPAAGPDGLSPIAYPREGNREASMVDRTHACGSSGSGGLRAAAAQHAERLLAARDAANVQGGAPALGPSSHGRDGQRAAALSRAASRRPANRPVRGRLRAALPALQRDVPGSDPGVDSAPSGQWTVHGRAHAVPAQRRGAAEPRPPRGFRAAYSVLPRALLEAWGCQPLRMQRVRFADGRAEEWPLTEIEVAYGDRRATTTVLMGP